MVAELSATLSNSEALNKSQTIRFGLGFQREKDVLVYRELQKHPSHFPVFFVSVETKI